MAWLCALPRLFVLLDVLPVCIPVGAAGGLIYYLLNLLVLCSFYYYFATTDVLRSAVFVSRNFLAISYGSAAGCFVRKARIPCASSRSP